MNMSAPSTAAAPPLPRGLITLLTAAGAMIVVAGLRAFAGSAGPLFLALVVVVVVGPVYNVLRRAGVSPMLSTAGLAITSFGVLTVMIAALVWTATRLVQLLTSDEYTTQLSDAQVDIERQLAEWGYTRDDLGEAFDGVDLTSVAGQVTNALSSLLGITSAVGLVLISMLFMVMDTGRFTDNLNRLEATRPAFVSGLQGFARSTRSYFFVSTVFGLIVAAFDVVALVMLGIPLALVWGVLSLITNYIPNIGFVLGLIPPAALAFFEGGWQLSVWVIVIYTVINVVIQSVIQPKFVGDAVGLSTTLTFVSLIFWGWVLGPLGALLAVPMTLLAKALLIDIDPTARWAVPLISLEAVKPAPTDPSGGHDDGADIIAEPGPVTVVDSESDAIDDAAAEQHVRPQTDGESPPDPDV